MLYCADLAWIGGGGLGPEGVADQGVEFRSCFHRLRPRDSECARPRRICRIQRNGTTEERSIRKRDGRTVCKDLAPPSGDLTGGALKLLNCSRYGKARVIGPASKSELPTSSPRSMRWQAQNGNALFGELCVWELWDG